MKKILLIEDDLVFANVYRNKLVLEGFQVEVASDGAAGYELLLSYRPDAVLLDLMLPKLPGVELIRKVRSQSGLEKLPLIVLTNTYMASTIQEAWKAGATKCLAKANCTPNEVIGTLRAVLDAPGPAGSLHAAQRSASAEPAPAPAAPSVSDDEFQKELRDTFIQEFPANINSLRAQLQNLIKLENETDRVQQASQLYRRTHTLATNAGMVGLAEIARLGDALQALLKELHEKPKSINASTLRTVASALDCLAVLFEHRNVPLKDLTTARTLVVDDEAISRRAVTHALDKAKLKSVAVEDPLRALDLAGMSRFDLVFLDVDMPNMNGYELCTKIRALPAYKKTPVVFVTSLNDFEARANSTMSGGNDFIAKPFLFIELSVKALVFLLRAQLPTGKR